jgi:uncharacterized protein YuzE
MLLFYLSVVLPLLVTAVAANNIKDQDIVEWVRLRGGYWNPKQELRHDEEGLFGVFAAKTIEEGEVLASLPWDVIIASPSYRFRNCDLVQLLANEMKNDDSDFGPYTASLRETVKHQTNLLPGNWSPEGKALLNLVIDNGTLPPEDVYMEKFEWKRKCDAVDKDATLVVITHGEYFGMAPLTDKYNSRGGSYTGAYFSIEDGNDVALEIRALRDLHAGEQIFTDYKENGEIGTPELLRDYGFVDFYPQRYIFHEQEIAFDVDETGNGLQVTWKRELLGKKYPVPTYQAIGFLREQLERLQRIYPDIQSHKDVPKQELDMIVRFCRDMIAALAQALVEDGECASGTKAE